MWGSFIATTARLTGQPQNAGIHPKIPPCAPAAAAWVVRSGEEEVVPVVLSPNLLLSAPTPLLVFFFPSLPVDHSIKN